MKIKDENVFKIQSHVAAIKRQAQDRSGITEQCDEISKILKETIEDATTR